MAEVLIFKANLPDDLEVDKVKACLLLGRGPSWITKQQKEGLLPPGKTFSIKDLKALASMTPSPRAQRVADGTAWVLVRLTKDQRAALEANGYETKDREDREAERRRKADRLQKAQAELAAMGVAL